MSRYQELISTGIVLTIVTGGIAGAVTGFALNEIVANRAVLAVAAALVAVLESHPPLHNFRGYPRCGSRLRHKSHSRRGVAQRAGRFSFGRPGCLQPRLQRLRSATRSVDRLPRGRDRGRVLRAFDDWPPSDVG